MARRVANYPNTEYALIVADRDLGLDQITVWLDHHLLPADELPSHRN